MSELTGKRRYRLQRRLFGPPLIVLQVEATARVGRPMSILNNQAFWWRDATFYDVALEIINAPTREATP